MLKFSCPFNAFKMFSKKNLLAASTKMLYLDDMLEEEQVLSIFKDITRKNPQFLCWKFDEIEVQLQDMWSWGFWRGRATNALQQICIPVPATKHSLSFRSFGSRNKLNSSGSNRQCCQFSNQVEDLPGQSN